VDPPTGAALRGPDISQTVNVIWELNGRSQYFIGKLIHSFQLRRTRIVRAAESQGVRKYSHKISLEDFKRGPERYGKGFVVCHQLACNI
jgi:hypothetical protein